MVEFEDSDTIIGENLSIVRGKAYSENFIYQGFPYKLSLVVFSKDKDNNESKKKWIVLEYIDEMREIVQDINNLADQCNFCFDQNKTPFLWADTAYSRYDEYSLKEKVGEMHNVAHSQIRLLPDLEFAYRDWISNNVNKLNKIMKKVTKLQYKKI